MGCDCYKIGGPFIAEDPDCPEHGWEAQKERERHEIKLEGLNQRIRFLEAERDAYKAEAKLLEHKVITCGVAASHSDADLTRTGAYAEKWNSQQAEQVRKLRAERDALRADAARYRWIKENAGVTFDSQECWQTVDGNEIYSCLPAKCELDVAIDAAISAKEQK